MNALENEVFACICRRCVSVICPVHGSPTAKADAVDSFLESMEPSLHDDCATYGELATEEEKTKELKQKIAEMRRALDSNAELMRETLGIPQPNYGQRKTLKEALAYFREQAKISADKAAGAATRTVQQKHRKAETVWSQRADAIEALLGEGSAG